MSTEYQTIEIKNAIETLTAITEKISENDMKMIDAFCQKIFFGNFYKVFFKIAMTYFKLKTNLYQEISIEDMLEQIYERIENIPIRVLITDIYKEKEAHRLAGNNSYEEYEYYHTVILGNSEYVEKLCNQYPVMKELILHQIYQFVEYICEIDNALHIDKAVIEKTFCNNISFDRASNIRLNLSDPHRKGKTVVKVDLDNGYSIIYKPHGLKKELILNSLYQVFMENSNFEFKKLRVIDKNMYGWEEYIEAKECNTEDEVERYFERMGYLLFVCYVFGATDIHCENIIASGEFPVLIDLETIPGIMLRAIPHTVEEYVRKKVNNSVIRTGILPTAVWGKNGGGIIVSALGNSVNMKTPFNLPYIKKAFSSDVHIEYAPKDINVKDSLPIFKGNIVGAAYYCDQICNGFEQAYYLCIKLQAKMETIINNTLKQKGRLIFRHTQQYSMYLNMSFYPQFLTSWEERYRFFDTLKEHKQYVELYQYEKKALHEMNFPIFEIDVKNGCIYDGESNKYSLQNFNIDKDYYKMKHLCKSDLAYQKKCIKLSLDMFTERKLPELLNVNEREGMIAKEKIITNIADYICESAVIFEGDISWDNLIFYDNNTWRLAPIDLDLYDGIGGIAIFLASINMTYPSEKYKKILELIQNKLFAYTEHNGHSVEKPRTKDSGILKGEGSIVYTYLLLYKITGDKKFLDYAEIHYSQFAEIFLQCKNPDYLSGCAGAIIVLTKLYSETANKKYLDVAEILGEKIWKMAKKQKAGYGIVSDNDNLQPLAGMAHGTSGYIMAYAYLFEQVPKHKYYERIIALLTYENSLYDSKDCNWKDFRKMGMEKNTIAWCHGAPGIALARLKLICMTTFRKERRIAIDIDRCQYALERNWKMESLCLCHGLAGNYWIEKYIQEMKGINNNLKIQTDLVEIMNRVETLSGMLPRERYNVSMMTGITGIGLFFNDELLCRYIFG